ncbi:MAG: NUDIX domain-containing protein [bacterium]
MIKLEELLNDYNSDYSTGLLIDRGVGFCFTIKKTDRWIFEKNNTYIPFGGIGGKIEANESPTVALHRESLEEVGSDVIIKSNKSKLILVTNNEIERVNLSTDILGEPLPLIIYKSPHAEIDRKPFTNVIIYSGEFTSNDIQPMDEPAIIEINRDLLLRVVDEKITIKDFKLAGGKIDSRIELPEDGILKPVGTAIATAICIKKGLI